MSKYKSASRGSRKSVYYCDQMWFPGIPSEYVKKMCFQDCQIIGVPKVHSFLWLYTWYNALLEARSRYGMWKEPVRQSTLQSQDISVNNKKKKMPFTILLPIFLMSYT